jgi:hypothetical protein
MQLKMKAEEKPKPGTKQRLLAFEEKTTEPNGY